MSVCAVYDAFEASGKDARLQFSFWVLLINSWLGGDLGKNLWLCGKAHVKVCLGQLGTCCWKQCDFPAPGITVRLFLIACIWPSPWKLVSENDNAGLRVWWSQWHMHLFYFPAALPLAERAAPRCAVLRDESFFDLNYFEVPSFDWSYFLQLNVGYSLISV